MSTISKIAIIGSSAHEKRRSAIIRSCKTLDDLHNALLKEEFKLSRSATYIRLHPRNFNTIEGKRHVQTAPVKLIKARTDERRKHVDTEFAVTSVRYLEQLASFLGPKSVFFVSQDDKARVPIGVTAANKQGPIIMNLEYRVTLPDHDFVVAEKHKLIPSVYAGISIKENGFGDPESVGYSGPTFVAIRSGKQSSSTATSHACDFKRLLELEEFNEFSKTATGSVKPVVIISVDGGPDENPRYSKVIREAIKHFNEFIFDA